MDACILLWEDAAARKRESARVGVDSPRIIDRRGFMQTSKKLGSSVLGMMALLAGCGGDDGTMMMVETLPDPAAWNYDSAMDMRVEVPLNFTCRGSSTRPAETGAATMFDLRAEDFQNHTPVPDVAINFYPDNEIPNDRSCTGTCVTGMTTADGRVTVTDALDS